MYSSGDQYRISPMIKQTGRENKLNDHKRWNVVMFLKTQMYMYSLIFTVPHEMEARKENIRFHF